MGTGPTNIPKPCTWSASTQPFPASGSRITLKLRPISTAKTKALGFSVGSGPTLNRYRSDPECRDYPEVELDINFTDRTVDLIAWLNICEILPISLQAVFEDLDSSGTGLGTTHPMTRTSTARRTIPLLAALICSGCAGLGSGAVQSWVYNQPVAAGPSDSGGGTASKNTLTLSRKSLGSEVGTMKVVGAVIDDCLRGTLDVKVEKTADAVVLLPQKHLPTCYDTRITIRADGSGGLVERRGFKQQTWVNPWPYFDWGLTPR